MPRFFEGTSFGTLGKDAQQSVVDFFKLSPKFDNLEDVFRTRRKRKFPEVVNFYADRVNQIEYLSVNFKHLSRVKIAGYEEELLFALYNACALYQLDLAEGRRQALKGHLAKIKQCSQLLDKLRSENENHIGWFLSKDYPLTCALNDSEKPMDYFYATVYVQLINEYREKFIEGSSSVKQWLKSIIGVVNTERLYWVWTRCSLDLALGAEKASQTVDTLNPYTGNLSWGMYLFRFLLELTPVFKHSISYFQSPEEKMMKLSPAERWEAQWDMRKYTLLNDSIWGIANYLCFAVLTSAKGLGIWGDGLTAALLVMDLVLMCRLYEEEETYHKARLRDYDKEISSLQLTPVEHDSLVEKERKRNRLAVLIDLRAREVIDWEYNQKTLFYNKLYAGCLCLAFLMILVAEAVDMTMTAGAVTGFVITVGTLLCFVFNVMSDILQGQVPIDKSKKMQELAVEKQIKLLTHFGCDEMGEEKSIAQQQEDYLMYMMYDAKAKDELEEIQKAQIWLTYTTTLHTILPPIVYCSYALVPLGIGIPLIISCALLAAATGLWIKRQEIIDGINTFCCGSEDGSKLSASLDQFADWARPENRATLLENLQKDLKTAGGNRVDSSRWLGI